MIAVSSSRRAASAASRLVAMVPLVLMLLVFMALPGVAQEDAEPAPAGGQEAEPPAKGMTVSRMVICEGIEDREPVGAATEFPSDVGALYCFSEINRADPPVEIFHRWYIGDRLVNEMLINVRASHWRCWSRKTILPRWKGECRAEVVTDEGDILQVAAFTLE